MSMDHPATALVLDFLAAVGVPVAETAFEGDSFLPGMRVRRGILEIDPARPFYPGDLLHEAGHIAVTDPALRSNLDEVADDPAEEMAAIAWSYAAAVAIGLDPAILFHEHGYKGGGQALIDAFATGGDLGVPMLEWYGLTSCARNVERTGRPAFPVMTRWLR
jgi:hypothetical protein